MGDQVPQGYSRKAGDVPTACGGEPKLVDERRRGSTVSELGGGLGPDDLAKTPEERDAEGRRLASRPGEADQAAGEKESSGLASGWKGMRKTDGSVIESTEDVERPASLSEGGSTPPKGPASF